MLAKGQEKPSVGSQENGEQLPASEAFEVHVPRNQYLRKTKEELVDIIISLQQSPAPMEQPQLQVRSVAPDSSGTTCLRESYMRTTEQLLEGIDGLVECFGFAKECIHESCERNIQEGRKRIDQLKSQLDALRSSLQSLVFKQQSGGMLLREQIDSEQGLVKRCNDKVDAIVKKVSDLEESFEAFGKGSDSIKAGVKSANDQWHERPHRQVSESLDRISRSHSQVNAIADYVKAYQDHVEDMSDCNEELHGGISVRTAGLGGIIHELKEKEKENSELNRRLEAVEKRLEALGIGAAVDVGYPKQRVDDSSPSKYVTGREEIYTPQIPPVPRDVGEGKEQTDTSPSGAGIQTQSISGQGTPLSSKSVPIPKKQVETLTGVELSPEACVPLEETTPKESGPKTVQELLESFKNEFLQVTEAKDIASKLKDVKVLPAKKVTAIEGMDDENKAISTLFDHLWKQADYAMAESLCKVMKAETGYPNMNTLGNTMLECLQENAAVLKKGRDSEDAPRK